MVFKEINLIIFSIFLCLANCETVSDPDSEVESLNIRDTEDNLKVQLENTLKVVEKEVEKLRKQLDNAKKTMADSAGSNTSIQNLLLMHERISNLTASVVAARNQAGLF